MPYLGKRKFYNQEQSEENRMVLISTKGGAVNNTFIELEGLINKTALAGQYFGKSLSWLSQKMHGCLVYDKKKTFTEDEYHKLAEAFRDIARRLQAHADEIDAAAMDSTD